MELPSSLKEKIAIFNVDLDANCDTSLFYYNAHSRTKTILVTKKPYNILLCIRWPLFRGAQQVAVGDR